MASPPAGTIDYERYVLWSLAVFATIAALGVVVLVLRHRIGRDLAAGKRYDTFSMEALEAMRRDGRIDEAEFKALRDKALGLDAVGQSEDNPASSDDGGASMNEESGDWNPGA